MEGSLSCSAKDNGDENADGEDENADVDKKTSGEKRLVYIFLIYAYILIFWAMKRKNEIEYIFHIFY